MRFLLILVLAGAALRAQQTTPLLAPKPPMGWNSWDSYGLSITEDEYRANASVLADRFLKYGWRYAVVDEGWYLPNPEANPAVFGSTWMRTAATRPIRSASLQ